MSVGSTLLALVALPTAHYGLYRFTSRVVRPALPALMGLSSPNDVTHLNAQLADLNFPPIISHKDATSVPDPNEAFKRILFDLSVSSSLHLILLALLGAICESNIVFTVDTHVTINVLVVCVLYLTPMLFIWGHLHNNSTAERSATLILYALGTLVSSVVIVKGVFKIESPNLTQLGVHAVDVVGISSIAIINLLACASGTMRAYRWYTNRDAQLFEARSIELVDVLSNIDNPQQPPNLITVARLVNDIHAYKKGPKSLLTKAYWIYCLVRGVMWIITIGSLLNISLSNLDGHKRDRTTNDVIAYLLAWDEPYTDVAVSLVSLCMNVASTYRLVRLGDHLLLMALICGLSTLLALT